MKIAIFYYGFLLKFMSFKDILLPSPKRPQRLRRPIAIIFIVNCNSNADAFLSIYLSFIISYLFSHLYSNLFTILRIFQGSSHYFSWVCSTSSMSLSSYYWLVLFTSMSLLTFWLLSYIVFLPFIGFNLLINFVDFVFFPFHPLSFNVTLPVILFYLL